MSKYLKSFGIFFVVFASSTCARAQSPSQQIEDLFGIVLSTMQSEVHQREKRAMLENEILDLRLQLMKKNIKEGDYDPCAELSNSGDNVRYNECLVNSGLLPQVSFSQ